MTVPFNPMTTLEILVRSFIAGIHTPFGSVNYVVGTLKSTFLTCTAFSTLFYTSFCVMNAIS